MKEQVVLPACYWTVSPRALDVRLAPEANGSAGSPWTVSPLVPLPLGSVSKHLPTGALRKPPLTCFSSTLVCNGSPSPFTSSILVSIKPLISLFPLAIGHSLSSGNYALTWTTAGRNHLTGFAPSNRAGLQCTSHAITKRGLSRTQN